MTAIEFERREILRGILLMTVASAATTLAPSGRATSGGRFARFAYTGCRTTKERGARGRGINVFRVDPATGAWTHAQLVENLINPSFLSFDREQRFLYTVHGDASEISAFRVDRESGSLTLINQQSTGGKNPVALVPDQTNTFMIVANYATGSLALLPIRQDGGLAPLVQLMQLPGTGGPNKIEQTGSHPHHAVYDPAGRFLIVPDKGVDRIFTVEFDSTKPMLKLTDPGFVSTRPGAGPRHASFHPTLPFVYVNYELDSSLSANRYEPSTGVITPVQVVPSTPDTFVDANTSAEVEVHSNGRFVYISNRGSDVIGTYAIDASTGRVSPVGWTSSGGRGPRFMKIDPSGTLLHVANELTDTIVTFAIDPETGRLRPTGQVIETGSPTCIAFATI
ncbi:lactonase family protein [Bradyrhizobium sp.]|uniref:lactonase family protein n=1 Tax=Bradyrhizobium sp. TaxID=376 RepID=UPI002D451337|nr:lactonase family protein [Bradyrhizobium sp.]HZR73231.1 lactonase family protein [Bradyrhizobium sp.]